jgi:CheY-like chemotaxis protein
MQHLVLLVEDSETTVLVTQMQLEFLGYRVAIARNGAEAVVQAANDHPDLIVMDIHMPVMDGLQAAAEIRKNPQTNSIPILAATAKAMSGDRERCLASGCNAYLAKPFTHRELGAEIKKLLKDSP